MSPASRGRRHQGTQHKLRRSSGSMRAQPRLSHLLVLTAIVLASLLGVRLAATLSALVSSRHWEQPKDVAETVRGDQRIAPPTPATKLVEPAAGPPDEPAGPPRSSPDHPGDPMTMSAVEQLAAELARREEVLLRREQALAVRETAMALVEQRIQERAAQLEALNASTATLMAQVTAEDQARAAQLSRIYEAMKPRNAAAIFEQTGLELLLPIVRSMREAKLSAIVAAMSPDKAKALMAELAGKQATQIVE